jgi:DDE_Tnp_1-associated
MSDSWAATESEVAVAAFSPLLDILAQVPDPRRAEGKLYTLPHVLLFSILAIVSGCNSYRGIVTFIDVHRRRLNAAFSLTWKRAPAHTAIRYILQGLDPAGVEAAFRRHAALLQAVRAIPGKGSIALDGKTLRGSFDKFHDRAAAQVLSAFATDTALVLAHVDIAEKSNEIPAAQALLAELGVACGAIVTLDALHCQKNISRSPQQPTSP